MIRIELTEEQWKFLKTVLLFENEVMRRYPEMTAEVLDILDAK